jgi:alpha-tubulin suppressor-like RCC1 family protein
MKTRFAFRASAVAVLIPGLALAGGLELSSGSVVTSGMTRSAPTNAIYSVLDIAAGGSVTAVLQCDGRWMGLGSDGVGLIRDMPTAAIAMALGNAHGIAIVQDPQQGIVLRTWGAETGFVTYSGQDQVRIPPQPSSGLVWEGVAAGGSHSAAWASDGSLEMAGMNDFGQCSPEPYRKWEAIALGGAHSAGIDRSTHEVVCWGLNSSNQCASGSLQAVAVAAGLTHSVAITPEGRLVGWGSNAQGQIAFGSSNRSSESDGVWNEVKAGALHTVALRDDGLAQAWGDNAYGQCSLGGAGIRSRGNVDRIATGLYHTAIKQSGNPCDRAMPLLLAFGANFYGETGTPSEQLLDVANGDGFFIGIRRDRSLKAWGSRTDAIQSAPSGVFASCAAGAQHAGAITPTGDLIMWGSTADGRTAVPAGPGVLAANERWTRVACGSRHSVGLLTTGRVLAWGNNGSGQTSVPAGLLASNITAGSFFSGAVNTAGQPVIWGANASGQLSPDPNSPLLTAVAAGSDHWIGLTASGSIISRGSNTHGQCTIPTLESKAVAIAASGTMSGCLLSNGTMRVWGKARTLNGDYLEISAPALPAQTADGRDLKVHRVSLGGESVSALVGHEYVADHINGPYYTIQDAIDAAPIGGVVRVAAGRWYPRQIRSDMTGLELRGDITLTAENPDQVSDMTRGTWLFGSVSVTNNPIHDNTALTKSIITCWNNESPACVIRGFTLYGGAKGRIWPTNPASVVGGAIYIGNQFTAEFCASSFLPGASPTIERCRFVYGFAGYGGAIFIARSQSNIRNCEFSYNRAQTMGGAIYAFAHSGLISDCTFTNNEAANSDGGAMAIHTVGDAFSWCNSDCKTRVGCEEISEGCTRRFDRGAPRFDRCVFTGNRSNGYGGAISYSLGFRHPNATGPDGRPVRQVQLHDCLVYSNSAPMGGGGIAIGLEKWKSNPRADCPYPDNTGVELTRTQVQFNSSIGPGAYRYRDIVGPFIDQGGNSITPGATGNPCPADIDGSGTVDYGDLSVVMLLMGTWNTGDLDDNGVVDYGDVVYLLLEFGPCR